MGGGREGNFIYIKNHEYFIRLICAGFMDLSDKVKTMVVTELAGLIDFLISYRHC